jgi:drug/metabolite transporter (DMT)-like permease
MFNSFIHFIDNEPHFVQYGESFMSSNQWVLFALGAAICYGICPTMQKLAFNNGATPNGVQFAYGAGILILGFVGFKTTPFQNTSGAGFALIFGLLGGIALICVSKAFSMEGASPTTVTLVVGLFPIVATVSNWIAFRENIIWSKFLIAAFFAALALYFAVQSQPVKAP